MEFTKTDLSIFVSMVLLIVFISFVFPAVGFSSGNVSTSDIPEFNVSQGTIDFVQVGQPLDIDRPSEGTLRYEADKEVYQDNRRVWLEGNSDNGYEITLTNNGTQADPNASLFLNEYDSGSFNRSTSTEDSAISGNFTTLQLGGYIVGFDNISYTNTGQANLTIYTDFSVEESPGGQSTFGGIPVIGGSLDAVARVIGGGIDWFGSIILGIFFNIGATFRNLGTIVWNIVSFFTGIVWWILVRYSSVLGGSPAPYVTPFLSIPGVVLSFEFAKLMIIAREKIPVI